MKRSLRVAMDAKKESAFLRRENVVLKERMDQLLEAYNCMKKDVECFRSHLEAGKVLYKKMHSDSECRFRELQSRITKLTSLLEDEVPKEVRLADGESAEMASSEDSLKHRVAKTNFQI